jgi:hypothetical protein
VEHQAVKVKEYEFGTIEYYQHYVIGRIKSEFPVDTKVAKTILIDLKQHYKKSKYVYISDREFGHKVDLSVYKLVDSKRLIAIALVSSHREELIIDAGKEQALYSGSFGVFKTVESAVSWALSFVEDESKD